MSTMNISLSDALRRWVDDRVASGDYSTASEYVRELIRKDRAAERERIRAKYEALIMEGLESGEGIEVTPEFWEELRREVEARVEANKQAKRKAG